jgi:4-hydroxybenzoate polyprenyltransferase
MSAPRRLSAFAGAARRPWALVAAVRRPGAFVGALRRPWAFVDAVFKPQVYGTYAVLWVLALEGSAALLAGQSWRPGLGTAARVVTVLLALLYLRIVDEQKDLDYDRVHHPDRPLVRGDVSLGELRVAMGALVAVMVALNVWFPTAALLVLLAMVAYAVFLVALERLSAPVRDGLLLNLAVTYPVQLLISVYIYLSAGHSPRPGTIALIAIFVCVFLHFEFARKTSWRTTPGSRFYSAVLGPVGSATTAVGFALAASALIAAVFRPWHFAGGAGELDTADLVALLPYLALAFPLAAVVLFWRRRPAAWPVPLSMGFVVTSYLLLTVQAAAS